MDRTLAPVRPRATLALLATPALAASFLPAFRLVLGALPF
jgi:hypothetical protein